MAVPKNLTNSVAFQSTTGVLAALGSVKLRLNLPFYQGATLLTGGQIYAEDISISLDANANLSNPPSIWASDQIQGTPAYNMWLFDKNGSQLINFGPVVLSGSSPIDLSTVVTTTVGVSYPNVVLQTPAAVQSITGFPLTLTASAPLITQGTLTATGNVTATAGANSIRSTTPGPNPWIDVTDPVIGLKGDGITDNASAWNTYVGTIAASANIFFPCGNFLFKSSATLPLNIPIKLFGAGYCTNIIKDFDSTPLFRTANQSYGTQTTLTANAAVGDQRVTVTNSAGFSVGQWIQIDDNTGLTGTNCTSYAAYEPAALSCNLELVQINAVIDSTHLGLRTSLDSSYTTAGSARISVVTPGFYTIHDFRISHGPDCSVPNNCTQDGFDLIFPVELDIHNITVDINKMTAAIQLHRGRHISIHHNVFRNGADAVTKVGQTGDPIIVDEASAYGSFTDNTVYKVGQAAVELQSHHWSLNHNRFNGCADDCINTHGHLDHDITISNNVFGGFPSSDTNATVDGRCVVVTDTDYNISIENNVCATFSIAGIQASANTVGNTYGITVKGNEIYSPVASGGTFPPNWLVSTASGVNGILFSRVIKSSIEGNIIRGAFPANSQGINCIACQYVEIANNQAHQTATVTGDVGIYVQTSGSDAWNNVTQTGNIVTGWNNTNCRWDVASATGDKLISTNNNCATGPGTAYLYSASITNLFRGFNIGDAYGWQTNLGQAFTEASAATCAAGLDVLWGDSTDHRLKMCNNNGTATDVAGLADFAVPPAIGNTTPAAGSFTTLSASTSLTLTETAAPAAVSGKDVCYGDSTAHAVKCSYNNGSFLALPQVIASGTSTLTSATVTTNTCQTVVTTAATGAATTDAIEWAYATNPGTADALMNVSASPTSGNVNFTRCNPTSASQSGTAIVINWRVVR